MAFPIRKLQPIIRPPGAILQRKCACGTHIQAGSACPACAGEKKGPQAKLAIGSASDPLEQEADRVAGQALSRFGRADVAGAPLRIQRFASRPAAPLEEAPASVDRALETSGSPLDAATRRDMEPRFGHDFSKVRVHTGSAAASSAREIDAQAYTVGSDIVFGAGRFAPATSEGRRLLAHELTHCVQQGASTAASGSLVRRAPLGGDLGSTPARRGGAFPGRHGGPLPYREATELSKCLRIMGEANSAYCRQEVLGEQPPPKLTPAGQALATELETIIAGAEWKEIRKRVYPLESAAGIKRSRDRRALLQPDMIGLGRLKSLDQFASKVGTLQATWTSFADADARVAEIGKIAGEQLEAVDVPKFKTVNKEEMEFKGYFSPSGWRFAISEALVNGASLDDKDAAELANVSLHEGRHAEQHFLSARYSAGVNNLGAAALATEQKIPDDIAAAAVAAKFGAGTDKKTADLGKLMFKAMVTDQAANQKISDDDGLKELKTMRDEASSALAELWAAESPETTAKAVAKRDALKAQIAEVERRYTLYRNIPYEADAHEVGDAAEEAFRLTK